MAPSKNEITILVILSSALHEEASKNSSESPWTINKYSPIGDQLHSGTLSTTVGVDTTTCELCYYSQGVVEAPVDMTKTPEMLGLKDHFVLYLRTKGGRQAGRSGSLHYGAMLSAEEEGVLRHLRRHALPNMRPDDPCPLCNATRASQTHKRGPDLNNDSAVPKGGESVEASVRGGAAGARGGIRSVTAATIFSQTSDAQVQCGIASRLDDPVVPVLFGDASRLRMTGKGGGGGGDKNYMPHGGRTPNTAGLSLAASAGGVTHGGGNQFNNTDEVIADLTQRVDRLRAERDEFAIRLNDLVREKAALEDWKREHRCETSTNVSALKKQVELMQQNLKDLMRGREEVVGVLRERQRAGGLLKDTPHPYPSFAISLPKLSYADPHDLLALGTNDPNYREHVRNEKRRLQEGTGDVEYGDERIQDLLHRPSGRPDKYSEKDYNQQPSGSPAGGGGGGRSFMDGRGDEGKADIQTAGMSCPPGQCRLRVSTTIGDPFYVQRKLSSHIVQGKNMLTLMSLDSIVTDEIYVDELEMASAPGKCGLVLGTRRHEWHLSMSEAERTNWLNWLYALNPWLTPNRAIGGLTATY